MLESDNSLILGLKQGDKNAFEFIYKKFHQRLFTFCNKLMLNSDDADDVVQRVFITLWEQREKVHIEKTLTGYIYALARNIAYNDLKQAIHKTTAYELYVNSKDSYLDIEKDEVLFKELIGVLNDLIEQLPPQRRLIFRLNRFYKLTYRTISQKLNITENTVDTQIRRALDFLRKRFEKY
jgi:RNA polymerase sigma-70 factor (ECF subfamily)